MKQALLFVHKWLGVALALRWNAASGPRRKVSILAGRWSGWSSTATMDWSCMYPPARPK